MDANRIITCRLYTTKVMVLFNHGVMKVAFFVFLTVAITLVLLRTNPILFPPVQGASETFDCDDSALAMYEHFQSYGIQSWPIIGNLEAEDEAFADSNHVWLLVDFGLKSSLRLGMPPAGQQHYEG
jgi:hypothetical protein